MNSMWLNLVILRGFVRLGGFMGWVSPSCGTTEKAPPSGLTGEVEGLQGLLGCAPYHFHSGGTGRLKGMR